MQLYVVTGGIYRNSKTRKEIALASTEILKKGWGQSWKKAASLPYTEIRFLRGVSLANGHFLVSGEELWCIILNNVPIFIITGGQNRGGEAISGVLDYDPDADKWTRVGYMAKTRYYHGMSLVPKETANYCVWCVCSDYPSVIAMFYLNFRKYLSSKSTCVS